MGMDVYVGSLTRYTSGEWLTVVQQTLQTSGHDVRVIRAEPDPSEAMDPVAVSDAVRSWQACSQELSGGSRWSPGRPCSKRLA